MLNLLANTDWDKIILGANNTDKAVVNVSNTFLNIVKNVFLKNILNLELKIKHGLILLFARK